MSECWDCIKRGVEHTVELYTLSELPSSFWQCSSKDCRFMFFSCLIIYYLFVYLCFKVSLQPFSVSLVDLDCFFCSFCCHFHYCAHLATESTSLPFPAQKIQHCGFHLMAATDSMSAHASVCWVFLLLESSKGSNPDQEGAECEIYFDRISFHPERLLVSVMD